MYMYNHVMFIGYDGAAAMSGQFSGVQAEIKRTHPKAVYFHCASHCLNLTLSKASKVYNFSYNTL